MGIPWDGTGINCYVMGWAGKYVPWTILNIPKLFQTLVAQ